MHYERTYKIQEIICELCRNPLTCNQIALRLNFSSPRTMYHIRQLIADHRLYEIKKVGRMGKDTISYKTNDGAVALDHLNKKVEKILIDEPIRTKSRDQKIRDSYAPGSAMRNVNNLAEKLRLQSEFRRSERKSSRTHVGISEIYNG